MLVGTIAEGEEDGYRVECTQSLICVIVCVVVSMTSAALQKLAQGKLPCSSLG